jgi:signal transduction histidine kinase
MPNPTPVAAPPAPPPAGANAHELQLLLRMAVGAADAREADEVYALVCSAAAELVGAEFALVALPHLSAPRAWCGGQDPPREAEARLLELLLRARDQGEALVAGELAEDAGAEAYTRVPPPFAAATAVALPLANGDKGGCALLVGWHGSRALDARTLGMTSLLAQQAGAAFRNVNDYQTLRRAAEKRERFFSAMSHDLRTPITAIMGYSELLQDGIMGDLHPHQQEMVERICQVSWHLAELVNDVLDIAKLDAERMEFHREPVALGELADEALVAVEPQARAKGLEVRLDIDGHREVVVELDASRVRQVLVNLLSNAVKFTEQGWVLLRVEVGERLVMQVEDSGPGLPPGSEEAVFEEFLQIASGSRAKREPGSGLGLAISRRLAKAMGGELVAANAEGGGALFTFRL